MTTKKISNASAIITILIALFFWYVTFAWQPFNFWLSMSVAATILSILAIYLGGAPFRTSEITLHAVFIGVGSAFILYGIFWLGNVLAQMMFGFARDQISLIYQIRTQGEALVIALVLIFITSPGEEIFWRGFLQRWTSDRFGEPLGWLAGAAIYSGVHILSGNFMLVMAALVAGLFWGYIYWKEKSIVPGIISHIVWTIVIFVLFPVL